MLRIILLSHCNNYHNLKNVGYVLKKIAGSIPVRGTNPWGFVSVKASSVKICLIKYAELPAVAIK